jgi:tetratricopeptide (TPR) repeat protein
MRDDRSVRERIERWLPLAVVLAGFLAYSNSYSAPFLFDDTSSITANRWIYHWIPWKAHLHPTRFLSDFTFRVNYALSGFNATDYRITNVLIHVLAALVLQALVCRTFRLPRWGAPYRAAAPWLAMTVALLWVAHPLQTESVTYIVQRLESLMGLAFLATLYLFVRGLTSERPRGWMDAAIAVCGLGMGTKEVMVFAPVVLYLYDAVLVAGSWWTPLRLRWRVYLALALTLGVFAVQMLRVIAEASAIPGGLILDTVGPMDYFRTQLGVLVHYLRLVLVPHPLCLDYVWPMAETWREVALPGALLVVLGLATGWTLVRRHAAAVPAVAAFLMLAPTSSFLPLPDAAFEHRMYLPLAPVLVLVVGGMFAAGRAWVDRAAPRRQWAWGTAALATVVLAAAVLVGLTRQRNLDYRSEEAMWRDVIDKRPDNYRAYVGLSHGLIGDERFAEAATVCSNLLARLPNLAAMGTNDVARVPRYRVSMYAMAHVNLGIADLNLHRLDEARRSYGEALRVAPEHLRAHSNLAYLLFQQGEFEGADLHWRKALEADPHNAKALCFRGLVAERRGEYAAAARHYRAALQENPDFLFVATQLAWLLATCPEAAVRDGRQAVVVATPLISASGGRSPRAFDVMAAACAEAGDFDAAVRYAERALSVAAEPVSTGRPAVDAGDVTPGPDYSSEALRRRLELYRSGKPFRTER